MYILLSLFVFFPTWIWASPSEVLGISPHATKDEVRSAYRRLAIKFHPDYNSSPDAKEKFQQIQEAYEQLTRPEKNVRKFVTSGFRDYPLRDVFWSSNPIQQNFMFLSFVSDRAVLKSVILDVLTGGPSGRIHPSILETTLKFAGAFRQDALVRALLEQIISRADFQFYHEVAARALGRSISRVPQVSRCERRLTF